MWTEGVPVEPEALQQLINVAQLPIVHGHVAAMPDVHAGHRCDRRQRDSDQGRDHPGGRRAWTSAAA